MELTIKTHVVEMLKEGFVVAPCANPDCENLFASDAYCSTCDREVIGENA